MQEQVSNTLIDIFKNFLNTWWWLIVIIVIGYVIKEIIKNKNVSSTSNITEFNVGKKKLLSKTELEFYKQLEEFLSSDLRILLKVRMEDVIHIFNNENKHVTRNKIKSRHFDFVIWDSIYDEVVSIIELDDKSHNNKIAEKADNLKNEICSSAKIKLLRFWAGKKLSQDDIKNILTAYSENEV